MRKILRHGFSCFSMLLVLTVFLLHPLSVKAELDDDAIDYLKKQVTVFLEQTCLMSDDQLDALGTEGGFYEVFSNSWKEDRQIVGELVMIHEPEVDDSDPNDIIVNTVVDFKNYTSDVVMYFSAEDLSPKNYVMNIRYSMKEKMQQAAQNMAVGLIVVFAILLFLMLVIYLFRFIPDGTKKKKAAEAVPEAPAAPPAAAAVQPETPAVTPSAAALEEEIAAVIAAAIAAASEEAPSASGYVVRSVRRKPSAWKRV